MSPEEEIKTMQLVARGDSAALADLYDHFSKPIYSMVYHILRQDSEVEEVVQDVFVLVWKKADTFDQHRAGVFSWLATIARNKAIDRLRASKRRLPANLENGLPVKEEISTEVDPATRTDQNERAAIVSGWVSELSPNQREAIQLAYFEGLTHSEIAVRLKETVGTVKARIRLAMEKLRLKVKGGVRG